jgi:cell division septation protein DedD
LDDHAYPTQSLNKATNTLADNVPNQACGRTSLVDDVWQYGFQPNSVQEPHHLAKHRRRFPQPASSPSLSPVKEEPFKEKNDSSASEVPNAPSASSPHTPPEKSPVVAKQAPTSPQHPPTPAADKETQT